MTKEDKQRVIGKIVAINSDRFTVELLGGLDNFNVSGFDDIHYFAQLNSYVIIPYQNYYIVAEVIGVREKDLNTPFTNPKDQFLQKIKAGKYLDIHPIGTLVNEGSDNLKFNFGVGVYPSLYNDVLYIKETELDSIFHVDSSAIKVCKDEKPDCSKECECPCRYSTLGIGTSLIFPDYEVKLDIDKFFGSHSAILGNTGSGKSCTITSILQGLYKYKKNSATGSTFVFFDVNGEYEQAFSNLNSQNTDVEVSRLILGEKEDKEQKSFSLPHWFLNIDEWSLLLKASERSQIPILRNALGFTQNLSKEVRWHIHACGILFVFNNWESAVAKRQKIQSLIDAANFDKPIDLSSYNVQFGNFPSEEKTKKFLDSVKNYVVQDIDINPSYESQEFEFEQLEEALDLAILYEEYHGNKQIRDYCSSMITRFKSIKERDDFKFLTKSYTSITEENYVLDLLGIDKDVKKSQVVLINLNLANDEMNEIISSVLARLIFERLRTLGDRNSFPVNIVLEEAHRYVSKNSGKIFNEGNNIFERIAKEGRKYGLFLLVSSQRPSELSKTVLSQCSNFIVHRIQNPDDLNHIRQITPHISETVLKRLPSIPTQQALIFGHSVNLPTTFKVNDADPRPRSDNNEISKNWFKAKGFKVTGFAKDK